MNELFYRVSKENLDEIYNFHFQYTNNKRTMYIWDWEYGTTNPHNSVLVAVKNNEKVIATQGMMSIKVAFGKDVYTTGKNESLLIDNDYRGKSLSTSLYNYAIKEYEKEGISCLWGFSRKAIIPLRKANFVVFEDILKRMILSTNYSHAQLLIPKTEKNIVKRLIFKIIIFFATLYSILILKTINVFKVRSKGTYEILEDLKKDNDILLLYEQLYIQYPELIYIYQDKDFYNWRIKKSPYPIKTIFIYDCNILKGYLYLKIQNRFCEITDFTFVNEEYGKLLLKELNKIIFKNNYGVLYYTGNKNNKLNKKIFNLLFKNGFIKIKGPNHFVLRNFSFIDEAKLFKIENWYINDLWSEGI